MSIKHIILDIETLPCANPVQVEYLLANVKADPRLKDPEKIKADIEEKRAEVVGKTGLDGSFGRILCASIADSDGGEVMTFSSPEVDEAAVLRGLLAGIESIVRNGSHTAMKPVIVGHNIGWDLRFIAQRCVVNGVRIDKRFLPFDAKPWEQADTMTMWAGAGNRITLDRLCAALGVESPKGEMDGSKVAEYFEAGRLEEIIAYNRADVEATRSCYWWMRQMGMAA